MNEEIIFKTGECAKLKFGTDSTTPKMTVDSVSENEDGVYVLCTWWDKDKYREEWFKQAMLDKC